MNNPSNITDPEKIEIIRKRHFAFRLNIFFFCVFFVFSILIVRLAILQFVEGNELAKQENSNSVSNDSIAPIRGNIYDKNGYEIAVTESTQSLFYRYNSIINEDDVIALARRISEIITKHGRPGSNKMTPAEVLSAMDVGYDLTKEPTKAPGYSFIPRRIKVDLSDEEIAYISEHRDELQGLNIVEESTRKYSPETIAPQLVGYLRRFDRATEPKTGLEYYKDIAAQKDSGSEYLNTETVGFDGIELMYQKELRGENGSKSYIVNASQQIISQQSITPPKKGNNLYLTIDKDVQLQTEKAIMDHLAYMKTDEARALKYPAMGRQATTGYAVAMEVKTGKVVAMASMPDYDPNVWKGGSISSENWVNIQPFYQNGTIREVYPNYPTDKERAKHPSSLVPLGSTMKPLTVLVGLNEKVITADEIYPDDGLFTFGRKGYETPIRNSDGHAYGPLNALNAIRVSSNTYMSEMIGNRLYKFVKNPVDVWDSYMKKFGLGVKTGSGLPQESAGTVDYYNYMKSEGSAQSALVFASFGQQGRYTALQLAQYATALASHGKRLKPQFVEKMTTFEGDLVQGYTPEVIEETKLPDSYWDVIEKGMLLVRKQGFDDFPYKVASKTGTSEQLVGGNLKIENAVFIAYAPVEDPVLAVAVIVPEGGFGSWGAAPIARKIFDAYDQYIGLSGGPKKQQTVVSATPTLTPTATPKSDAKPATKPPAAKTTPTATPTVKPTPTPTTKPTTKPTPVPTSSPEPTPSSGASPATNP